MTPSVSVKARFGWFALGHTLISLMGCGALVLSVLTLARGEVEISLPYDLLLFVLMLSYLPAGFLVARRHGWGMPSRRGGVLAVLLPALIAWLWAVLGVGLTVCRADTVLYGAIIVGFAAVLASPSFLFMFYCTILGVGSQHFENAILFVGVFLAGLLPPLLFFLGTLAGRCPPPAGASPLTTPENVIK